MLTRRIGDWTLIVAVIVAGGWLADQAGLPGGYLFAALLIGLVCALTALQLSYLLAVLASLVCRGWCTRFLWPQRP